MTGKTDCRKPTVIIIAQDIFSVRNVLYTPLWERLVSATGVNFVIVTPFESHGECILRRGSPNVSWALLPGSVRTLFVAFRKRPTAAILLKLIRTLVGRALSVLSSEIHVRLLYRFNHLQGFRTHRLKLMLPRSERHKRFGELRYLGWPSPGSKRIYFGLLAAYQSTAWPTARWLRRLLDQHRPSLVVIAFPQTPLGFSVSRAAKKRSIPVIGYINSWDQPTTKGPIPPSMKRVLVWNEQMRDEVIRHHALPEHRLLAVGPAHIDLLFDDGLYLPRDEFLQNLGASADRKLIVYGTYNDRLGPDEPGVARHLARCVVQGKYGPAALVIRTYPKDGQWKKRFANLHAPPDVVVRQSSDLGSAEGLDRKNEPSDDMVELANLLKHADVVLNGPGTFALDAIALGTPVVSIAFDGDRTLPYERSIAFRYEYDHYAKVVKLGGSVMVTSYEELDRAVIDAIENPGKNRDGRARVQQQLLAPCDGRAGERIVEAILAEFEGASW